MDIETAKQTVDIIDFLAKIKCYPVKIQGHCYWYISPIRSEERTASFKVDIRKKRWYDFGTGESGDVVGLGLRLIKDAKTTSDVLKAFEADASYTVKRPYYNKRSSQFTQEPEKMHNKQFAPLTNTALLSYMMRRSIDLNIGRVYCCEVHYTYQGKHFFAIAFRNQVGGYEIRNPYFKGCIGHKDITIIPHKKDCVSEHCCLFEGFMDFLSYLTLCDMNSSICINSECDYIILNSVNNIAKVFEELEKHAVVHAFLDNDLAGQRTYDIVVDNYHGLIVNESEKFAPFKDLNDYLVKSENKN